MTAVAANGWCNRGRPADRDRSVHHGSVPVRRRLGSRLFAPLAVLLVFAMLACATLAWVLARQGDDRHQAERRAFVSASIKEFRSVFADFARHRADEVAHRLARELSPAAAAPLLSPEGLRFGFDRAYLVDASGTLIASFPEGERVVPALIERLVATFRTAEAARTSAPSIPGKARVIADYLPLDDRPSIAAVAEMDDAGLRSAAGPAVLVLLAPLDQRLTHALEVSSGIGGLTVESSRIESEREVHGVFDRDGRIVGWLTWTAERPMTRVLVALLPILIILTLGLVGLAGLSAREVRRSTRELAENAERARALAYEDALTGLPNRRRVFEFLATALTGRADDKVVTFAFLNLDNLEEVNDALGHHGGDELLAMVGGRLHPASPELLLVGRLNGDEFAMVMMAHEIDAAVRAVEAVAQALTRPFWINGQVVQISASFGLAHAPRDGTSPADLMRRADLALRAAKKLGRGRIVSFQPVMEAELHDRRFIKGELRRALGEGTLDLYYQPVVAADASRIVGVEALLRWEHKTRGHIPPTVFVPMAEQTGLMVALGEYVLRKALADALRWPNLYIAINISPVQIRDRGFVDLVAGVVGETGIAPARIVLEVTEGVLIDDPDEGQKRLEQLRALGVRIALDDFGSGYSSLGYLQRFPFDKLKIDKTFVAPLGRLGNGAVIIQSIVGLGRALGLSVLAEGVETDEQRALLRLAGCDELQGFLFGKPSPREAIDEIVAIAEARGFFGRSLRLVQASAG